MLKFILAAMILFSSSADADEVRELVSRAKNCIAVPTSEPNDIHRLKTDGSEVIFGSLQRLDYLPNKKSSPNGFQIAGLSNTSVKWIAVFDIKTSPPTFYNSRLLEGALDWTGVPQDIQNLLVECGFNFACESVEPPLRDRGKSDGSYPEFALPKIDWE